MALDKRRGWTLVVTSLALSILGYGLLLVLPLLLWGTVGPSVSHLVYYYAILISSGLLIVAAFVVYVVWFVLQNRDMNRLTGGRFLTVVWTILLFVPIFNLMSSYKFADHIHQAQLTRGVTGMHPVSLFLLLWLVSFVGLPMAQAQMDRLEAAV